MLTLRWLFKTLSDSRASKETTSCVPSRDIKSIVANAPRLVPALRAIAMVVIVVVVTVEITVNNHSLFRRQ